MVSCQYNDIFVKFISILTTQGRRESQRVSLQGGAIDKKIQKSESQFLVRDLTIVPYRLPLPIG